MKYYKITFEDGNTLTTGMNATLEEAKNYYTNNVFNFGDTDEQPKDLILRGVKVEELS